MLRLMTRNCAWWRAPQGWESDDPDLARLRDSPLGYKPAVLADIEPDGLYVLRGPRRVGKSVAVKRTISDLIHGGVHPRRIIHFACDGRKAPELRQIQRVGRDQATAGITEPRYWFLDEITAVAGWPSELKWLRDNTEMQHDCVVLTGSSSRDLDDARKELAGRRGEASPSDRLLLPMSFKTFCQQFRPVSELPDVGVIRAADFLGAPCREAVQVMVPWLDQLVSLWEVYCGCGGLPPAVAGQLLAGEPSRTFVTDLFDIVHGDALGRGSLSTTQSLVLLNEITKSLTSFMNMSHVARELGVDQKTAAQRVADLIDNYLVWPCHQRGTHAFPHLAAQSKHYFTDPLLAHVAHLRNSALPAPDTSVMSEQQIGQHLVRQAAGGDPGSYGDFTSVMCVRTRARKEVDFLGSVTGAIGFEGKYSDTKLEQESATVRSVCGGRGVLATRATVGTSKAVQTDVRFIPAAFVAYLLSD